MRWATRTGGGTAPIPRSSTNLRISTYQAALAVGRPDRRQLCGGLSSGFCGGPTGQLHSSSTQHAAFAVGRPDRHHLCGGPTGQAQIVRWADRTGTNCVVGHADRRWYGTQSPLKYKPTRFYVSGNCYGGLSGQLYTSSTHCVALCGASLTHRATFTVGRPDRQQLRGGPRGQAPIVWWATRTGGGTAHIPRSSTNLRISTYLAALAVGRPDRRQLCGGLSSGFCGGPTGQPHSSSTQHTAFAVG